MMVPRKVKIWGTKLGGKSAPMNKNVVFIIYQYFFVVGLTLLSIIIL